MKNLLYLLIPLIITTACGRSTLDNNIVEDSFEWVIDSMDLIGYKTTGVCDLPSGISDTLIYGYTDRAERIFYVKKLHLTKLKISGIGFEKKEESWTKKIMYYRFDFESNEEKIQFEDFQFFCEQYQTHGKNQVHFIQKDSTWFLEFRPMP